MGASVAGGRVKCETQSAFIITPRNPRSVSKGSSDPPCQNHDSIVFQIERSIQRQVAFGPNIKQLNAKGERQGKNNEKSGTGK